MKGRRESGQRPDSVIIHNRDEQLFVFLFFLVAIDNAVFTTKRKRNYKTEEEQRSPSFSLQA